MLPAKPDGSRIEGGITTLFPDNVQVPIYDAAMTYIARGIPTVILAGE
jgi:aconitate hydratase